MLPGIGVFGTGSLTKVLVPLLKEKGFHVVAIWGRTFKEAKEKANELKIPFYTTKIDDVLLRKDVDLVFIICPPYLHSEISVKALGIGKHVVCDKPMGLNQADALKMVRASQYYPTLISLVIHSLRFLPAFIHMKKAITDGLIGPTNEIYLIEVRIQMGSLLHGKYDWMCDASMGGGTLNLIGSHVIDLISYLVEKRAIRVHGLIRTYTKTTNHVNGIREISAPDFCTFQMELDGGITVTVSLHNHSVVDSTFIQDILVCGSKGNLILRGDDVFALRTKSITNNSQSKIKEEAIYIDVQHDLSHIITATAVTTLIQSDANLQKPYIKGLYRMVSALKEAFSSHESSWIKEPVQVAANFEDGLYVQAVLDAIRKSSDTRSWTRVEITTESPTNHEQIMRFARMSVK